MSLFNKSQSPKNKKMRPVEGYGEEEKNEDKKVSDKKLLINNNKFDNKNIVNNKSVMIEEKETRNIDNSENKNCLQNKKEGKGINNIIINILNKPFLCCLQS